MDPGHGCIVEPRLAVVNRVGDQAAVERSARRVQVDCVVGEPGLVGRSCPVDQGEVGMALHGTFEVFVHRREVPGVLQALLPRRGRHVLRFHLAKRHPVDVLDTGRRQRGDHRIDRPVETRRVPVRVVVAASDHDVIADDGSVEAQRRNHVLVTQLFHHQGGRAEGVHLPVGRECPRQRGGSTEADRVAEERDAMFRRRGVGDLHDRRSEHRRSSRRVHPPIRATRRRDVRVPRLAMAGFDVTEPTIPSRRRAIGSRIVSTRTASLSRTRPS